MGQCSRPAVRAPLLISECLLLFDFYGARMSLNTRSRLKVLLTRGEFRIAKLGLLCLVDSVAPRIATSSYSIC